MANITLMPKTASIFDSKMKVLVNPVNTQGRSGKGLALEFAKRYPRQEKRYIEWYKSYRPSGGYALGITEWDDRIIIYACTKEDPRNPSKLESVKWEWLAGGAYNSFAIPALGCGLGGLKWDDVRPIIEAAFVNIDCEVELYPPR